MDATSDIKLRNAAVVKEKKDRFRAETESARVVIVCLCDSTTVLLSTCYAAIYRRMHALYPIIIAFSIKSFDLTCARALFAASGKKKKQRSRALGTSNVINGFSFSRRVTLLSFRMHRILMKIVTEIERFS